MPLRLNIGLSKKLGLPDYGSLGASCNVDIELDAALLQTDPEAFQRHARNVFDAAVARFRKNSPATKPPRPARNHPPATAGAPGNGNGNGNGNGHTNGNGNTSNGQNGNGRGNGHQRPRNTDVCPATRRHIMARVRRLDALAQKFAKPVAGLSSRCVQFDRRLEGN
jgi:hypothetical protein